ncbi:MAG: ribokinase [Desulfurococcales archaeon]|jgi:ribokinase|nr:ribokinase [Desulfurococcales archaeon]
MVIAIVVGSINVDFMIYLERFPSADETVSDGVFEIHFGGKGANQAVGLARLGSKVYMVGLVGADSFGDMAIENLRRNGVAVDYVRRTDRSHTGTAFILVNRYGGTMIAVAPGANRLLKPEDAENALRSIGKADVVLSQLEIPVETVARIARVSGDIGAKLILTPSPAKRIPNEILERVHTIVPNRVEACKILGMDLGEGLDEQGLETIARELVKKGVENVVITLGEKGAAYYTKASKSITIIPTTRPEKVVDTTGAGDSFTACYSYAIALGRSVEEAVRIGITCASIKITRKGAQEGMPKLEELLDKISQ